MSQNIDAWHDRQMQRLTEERDRALQARKDEERQTYAWVKRCLTAEEQRDGALKHAEALAAETEARADANFRLYSLSEKYHNEDMLLMLEMEKVIAAARQAVNGPDSQSYTRLSEALDQYEQAKREYDRTYGEAPTRTELAKLEGEQS